MCLPQSPYPPQFPVSRTRSRLRHTLFRGGLPPRRALRHTPVSRRKSSTISDPGSQPKDEILRTWSTDPHQRGHAIRFWEECQKFFHSNLRVGASGVRSCATESTLSMLIESLDRVGSTVQRAQDEEWGLLRRNILQ